MLAMLCMSLSRIVPASVSETVDGVTGVGVDVVFTAGAHARQATSANENVRLIPDAIVVGFIGKLLIRSREATR